MPDFGLVHVAFHVRRPMQTFIGGEQRRTAKHFKRGLDRRRQSMDFAPIERAHPVVIGQLIGRNTGGDEFIRDSPTTVVLPGSIRDGVSAWMRVHLLAFLNNDAIDTLKREVGRER